VLSVIAVRSPISTDHRFMTWMVPVLAILAASLFERWDSRRVLVLTAAAASFALVHLFQTFTNEMDGVFTRSATHLLSTGSLARYADVPSRHYVFMIEGFDVLERAAESDSVLYAGTDDSWMYPAWGARFTRHVRGVWNPADAAQQVTSGQYRFIVVEAEASGEIRNAVREAARLQGYNTVAEVEGRVILERHDASLAPASH
jgi:hypothetical protein